MRAARDRTGKLVGRTAADARVCCVHVECGVARGNMQGREGKRTSVRRASSAEGPPYGGE